MPDTKITIDNRLSNCIKIDATEVVYKDAMPMLKISHHNIQLISECGCKSAISEYSSQLEMDGYNSLLLTAKLIFSVNKLKIPLATDKKIIGDFNVLVSFSVLHLTGMLTNKDKPRPIPSVEQARTREM